MPPSAVDLIAVGSLVAAAVGYLVFLFTKGLRPGKGHDGCGCSRACSLKIRKPGRE